MKIMIDCPGSFTHGLDTPGRGEGRWAQNIARLLGKAGHNVYICSAESVEQGEGRPAVGVNIVPQSEASRYEPFDLYLDSCWYEGKNIVAKASNYLHVHWVPEPRCYDEVLPKNHYLAYFFKPTEIYFLRDSNKNLDRTFFLPAPFCEVMSKPGFDRKGLLWCSRLDDDRIYEQSKAMLLAVEEIMEMFPDLVHNVMYTEFSRGMSFPELSNHLPILPFHKATEIYYQTKLSLPVMMQSCIFDCTCAGVPSLLWEVTHMPAENLKDLARSYGILLEANASKDRIKEVILALLTDYGLYVSFTKSMQYMFRDHTEEAVLGHFNHMINCI
jgi:hypothetical protein